METYEQLKKSFGKHPVPSLLKELADYWDDRPSFFCTSFEVQADQWESAKTWFQEKEAGYSLVLPFGVDGIGSLYAFWLKPGRPLDSSPVVYLCGEFEGSGVIASDLREFLSILGSNREYEPFDHAFMEFDEETAEENKVFRKEFLEPRAIVPAGDPDAVMKAAQKAAPGFSEWLDEVLS